MQTKLIILSESLVARFWQRVDKTSSPHGCWLWTGGTSPKGYGYLNKPGYSQGNYFAHRISYCIHFHQPHDSLGVLHNCPGGDNPHCVNPAHLWLGTCADNNRDKWEKGRQGTALFANGENNWAHANIDKVARGERQGGSKLTESQVRQIRAGSAAGITGAELGRRFNISRSTIYDIVKRRWWKHIE